MVKQKRDVIKLQIVLRLLIWFSKEIKISVTGEILNAQLRILVVDIDRKFFKDSECVNAVQCKDKILLQIHLIKQPKN